MIRSFRIPQSVFHILGLAALVLLFYRQAAFTNLIFARGDTLLYFYPYWDYRAQTMLAGRLPLWNPYLFMGAPFLANSQAGVFYPLNWPLIFLSAPAAVRISIVAHVIIAAWGAYALARRASSLDPLPAAFAASVFAFGGYLTAQVEHVNQLQGLAWLPLALLATHRIFRPPSHPATQPPVIVHCSLLSLFIALQLTAGHTQTAFITLVACGVVAFQFTIRNSRFAIKTSSLSIVNWALCILLAFGLAAIQLVPTYELSRLSLRSGGLPLNEAVSFSLNPLLLGRALLPGYSRVIFSEFVAYIGVIPLVLAAFAVYSFIANRNSQFAIPNSQFAILLAALGLFFALGGYNPIYLLIARFVPGFNFFRVPARWLALWALGASILAGHGLQQIGNQQSPISSRRFAALALPPLFLVILSFFSASLTPPGELGPPGLPSAIDLALWLAPLAIALFATQRGNSQFLPGNLLAAAAIVELLLASSSLPLNHLTTPDAYTSIRPAMTQLLVNNATCNPKGQSAICNPPDRFLSLSTLEFDPGDLAELRSEWNSQLPPGAVYDAIVATKHKEVLSPNLPLTWRVPSVDGYDGGILPLRAWAEFAEQFGDAPANTDGRLRQFIRTIPPNDLLSLANTRWVITDKTGDAWVDNVFYDLGLTATATSPSPITIERIPDFQATALGLVLGDLSQSGVAQITLRNGETITAPITFDPARPAVRLRWSNPSAVEQIVVLTPTLLVVRGASLIDERTDSFQSLTLGPYRLAHSGDVKIYENLNVLPRAFLVSSLQSTIGNRQSAMMLKYEAERVVVQTTSDTPGYLILTDANYPGWLATVDGQPAEIQTAYDLFRAVPLSAGTHTVEFRFEPQSLKFGAIISVISLIALVVMWLIGYLVGRLPG